MERSKRGGENTELPSRVRDMIPNKQSQEATSPDLSPFGTMALVVQLLRSVKERCTQEAQVRVLPDVSILASEAKQTEPSKNNDENFLDKSAEPC